ncbi:MAG: M14-type cytosolic carboxypeptidase [Planctomycetales bacterium]
MKILFAACLVCATLPLYAETEFADISVTTDFPGGSADVKSIDRKSGVIHITPKTRSERGWPCWWYLKVEGAKTGQFITLKLTASEGEYKSGRVLNAAWSQPDRAAVSVDNMTWTQTPNCQKEDGAAKYRIEAPAGSFWLAWGPPFLPTHADEVLKSLKSRLPGATLFELAKTRGGRSVQGIRIGDASEKDAARYGVWIQARQHAWEAGSSWVGQGFVEWLATDDPAAARLRRSATVYYVPIMDVDNVAMGAGGKDAVPRDHNRDWDDKPHYPEVAAAQKRILKLNADGRFDVFIDLHNPGGSERRPYFFGPINLDKLPPIQQQNHARWQAFCASAISGPLPLEPRYKFATYVRTDEERNRMSANWVRNHTAGHVLSTTLETVWNTPHSTQQGYMKVGAQLGMALSRYLESNPREHITQVEVVVSPRVTVVEREGITGGGYPVIAGDRILNFYPNHTDDFGGSSGMGSAISTDGGMTWTKGRDNWPMPGMIDFWAERFKNGDLFAFGIKWVPDPAKRREVTLPDVPADAYQIAISRDHGRSWILAQARIECPPEVAVIARPLAHIIERENGLLLMPAYAWSKRGNKVVLLQSEDGGRVWKVRSVITTAVAMIQAGARVRTPWLEATVSPTKDGEMLAIVRTGSTVKSHLVSVRSSDNGETWEQPQVLPFAGKLPTLHLLNNGILTLTTALGRNHCRVYLSADGAGRNWSRAFVISSLTGGNVGAAIAGEDKLIMTTPANRRIDAWHLRVGPELLPAESLYPPTNLKFKDGTLTWTASSGAVAYRVTPVLIKPGDLYPTTLIMPYAAIQTSDDSPSLNLRRQLLLGSIYAFEVTAVDAKGRVSPAALSQEFQLR